MRHRKVTKRTNEICGKERIVLLMTATILPQEDRYLKLKNVRERLRQYMDSLKYYIVHTDIECIVFCENSNYKFDVEDIFKTAKQHGKRVEILQFLGSEKQIFKYGKGYGEGEIIEYALENSKLLKESNYFIKVTGRVKIRNIDNILKKIHTNKMYFSKSIYEYQAMDTVIFCIPKKVYMKFFGKTYKSVYDRRGKYIEYVFADVIRDNELKYYNLPSYPDIDGMSGSVGVPYQRNLIIEKKVYNLFSRLQLFNCNFFYNIFFGLYFQKCRSKI